MAPHDRRPLDPADTRHAAMKMSLCPRYRTADCQHSAADVWGCSTCGMWDLPAELAAVPSEGDEVTIPVSWMEGGPERNPKVAEEDDYHTWRVAYVSWHPELSEEPNVILRFVK